MSERKGSRWGGKAVVLGCLAPIVVGWAVVVVAYSGLLAPAPGEGKDASACSSSFHVLDQSIGYFGLTLPMDTAEVRHDMVQGPFNEYGLLATFRTTPDGLREFLASGGLPAPSPAPHAEPVTGCGVPAGGGFTEAVRESGGQRVTVQVHGADQAHPLVVLRAADD
ncbi:hypothetical protein AB0K43_00090 [Kitasatospora sp. NPDC049258]|uniref:hypothetical protein n=1 Tax=Kitasatospora sp. NPDC049258 TaxID=3155394 RepID=UPI00343675AA